MLHGASGAVPSAVPGEEPAQRIFVREPAPQPGAVLGAAPGAPGDTVSEDVDYCGVSRVVLFGLGGRLRGSPVRQADLRLPRGLPLTVCLTLANFLDDKRRQHLAIPYPYYIARDAVQLHQDTVFSKSRQWNQAETLRDR